jgi:adenylate kinase
LTGLAEAVRPGERFLLDGHYTVLRRDNTIQPIPLETFKSIAPKHLILLLDSPAAISDRLRSRGTSGFDVPLISKHQEAEQAHATHISVNLGIPLTEVNLAVSGDLESALNKYRAENL